jgi:hypothetical protein
MSLQIDGNAAIDEQQRQLQFVETFFVEVIDYVASDDGKNDITTKPTTGQVPQPLQLHPVANTTEVAEIARSASTIVFDRAVLIDGQNQRVIGFRG